MDQICECYKKLNYFEGCNIENSDEPDEEWEDFDFGSSNQQAENAVRLPGVLKVNDSVLEYPDVKNSHLPDLFQEMSKVIMETDDYEVNILSFWIVDVFLEGLLTAQLAGMSHRNQKATLHWMVYLYNIIQGSGIKMTRKEIFHRVKLFLLNPDDSDDLKSEETDGKSDFVSGNEIWRVPFPPVWHTQENLSDSLALNDDRISFERNSQEFGKSETALSEQDRNIRDMETILEILYRIYARLWPFILLQISLRSTPKLEIVDLPYQLNVPKKVLKYDSTLSATNKGVKKGTSLKNSDESVAQKELSKSNYILPLQAAEGIEAFLREKFAINSQEILSERDKGKSDKKKK